MKTIFICQLSKKEQFSYYKRIKKSLVDNDAFSYENVKEAMNSKIRDLEDII